MTAGDAIALGWYATERPGITTASEFGIGTLPADFYSNASVFSGTDHQIRIPVVPKKPCLENKAYVTIQDAQMMDGYARMSETYLQRSGLRVITIWDNANEMQRASYERNCRNVYGATVQNFRDVPSVRGSVEGDRVPFEKLVIPYAGSIEHLESSLQQELGEWGGREPLFLAYQVDVWHELKPDRIVEIASRLKEKFPNAVEFVRADHYFNLLNEARRLPWNLSMSADTIASDSGASEIGNTVTDGTPTTLWTAATDDSAAPQPWLQLDLGSVCGVHRWVIRHAGSHGLGQDKNTRDFTLQTSLDGQSWQTVDAIRGNDANVSDLEYPSVQTRYVRIVVENAGADSIARIADFEIYGSRTL